MKKQAIKISDLLNIFAFLLYLYGSSLAHIENGAELSLWLMTFAMIIVVITTVLPWMGFAWLRIENKGSRAVWWLSIIIRIFSWGTFGYAMYQRWARFLPQFHNWITLTTLLWAAWMMFYIYSRCDCRLTVNDDTLIKNQQSSTEKKREA